MRRNRDRQGNQAPSNTDVATEKRSSSENQPTSEEGTAGGFSMEQLSAWNGLLALVHGGLAARDDKTIKNRIIFGEFVLIVMLLGWNIIQYTHQPDTKVVSETTDGRIRPLPLLDEPLYSQKEILSWATKCVESIYRLSYVDWQTSINNNTFCLADASRAGFADSIKKVGLLQYLTKENQGNIYATTLTPEMRKYQKNENGYYEWVVSVPYTVRIDGRQHGTMDLLMTMKVRRVGLSWREDGLWVENYVVRPRSSTDGR
jgi:hypothetical protein